MTVISDIKMATSASLLKYCILDPSLAMHDELTNSSYMVNGCHSNGMQSLHDCDVSV